MCPSVNLLTDHIEKWPSFSLIKLTAWLQKLENEKIDSKSALSATLFGLGISAKLPSPQ